MPSKRSLHQRYILETHESSREELVPRYVNEKYFSRYVELGDFFYELIKFFHQFVSLVV